MLSSCFAFVLCPHTCASWAIACNLSGDIGCDSGCCGDAMVQAVCIRKCVPCGQGCSCSSTRVFSGSSTRVFTEITGTTSQSIALPMGPVKTKLMPVIQKYVNLMFTCRLKYVQLMSRCRSYCEKPMPREPCLFL